MIGFLRQVSISQKVGEDPLANDFDAYSTYRGGTIGVEAAHALMESVPALFHFDLCIPFFSCGCRPIEKVFDTFNVLDCFVSFEQTLIIIPS